MKKVGERMVLREVHSSTERVRDEGMTRRHFLGMIAMGGSYAILTSCIPSFLTSTPRDYSSLLDLITLEDKENPLYVFYDFNEDYDEQSHEASLEFFSEHPQLLDRIRRDLEAETLRWRLDHMEYRLVFVPEKRKKFAKLFEGYCHDVIDHTLEKTGLHNPYECVKTLLEERPEISDSKAGIEAYLVHNLAKEYVSTYTFLSQREKSVSIQLDGRIFLGELGSYTTNIYLKEDGAFEFVRDGYTLWQNSAKNPYTALMVPVEETFHITLREYTENAIGKQLRIDGANGIEEAKKVAEEWIAVEEAVAGGLVKAILPPFFRKNVTQLPDAFIQKDAEAKLRFKKYRYLQKGVQVVKQMGCEKVIHMYRSDPGAFRRLLLT
jgi:hypothetical protein